MSDKRKSHKIAFELKEIYDAIYMHTGNLSSVLRQLAFAIGAVAWILFTNFPEKGCDIKTSLIFTFICLFLYFICDAMQYAWASFQYLNIAKKMVENGKAEIETSEVNNCALMYIFILKIMSMVMAGVGFIVYCLNTLESL